MAELNEFKEAFLKTRKLTDSELDKTVGGVNTGEFDSNGEVYIAFPNPVSFLSGYYNTTEIEQLATDYIAYKSIIKMYVTNDIRNAVKELYKKEGKDIPANVKDILGI